jgi:hypothetical protein
VRPGEEVAFMEAFSERERTSGRGLTRFTALLQEGVRVRVGSGESVHAFLTQRLGVAAEYVAGRISTVFLDGQVVDDLHAVTLSDGSLLALSAAIPGLVGATLRRDGHYSAMRAEITRPARSPALAPAGETALVRVRLFNLLIEEIGPLLLDHRWGLDARDPAEPSPDGSRGGETPRRETEPAGRPARIP